MDTKSRHKASSRVHSRSGGLAACSSINDRNKGVTGAKTIPPTPKKRNRKVRGDLCRPAPQPPEAAADALDEVHWLAKYSS